MILGTRSSALALAQTQEVRALISQIFPYLKVEIKIIKTSGDQLPTAALAQSGIKGLFTKELEQALLLNKIHVAIHSLKDVPTDLPAGLMIGAVIEREEAGDILVGHPATSLELPQRVYTSSPRRTFQAQLLWPECKVKEIRGNIETRLCKLCDGESGDALLLAAAGLKRLNYLQSAQLKGNLRFDPPLPYRRLTIEEMLPAPGQAAIALEILCEDGVTQERLRGVNHPPTWSAVMAERAFLRTIGGGCATPIAAHATVGFDGLRLMAVVKLAGDNVWRSQKIGERRNAEALGEALGQEYRVANKESCRW